MPALPGVLIAVVSTILISKFTGYADAGGAVVGSVPKGLPGFSIPPFNLQVVLGLATSAIVIALIGFMEAISIASTIATVTPASKSALSVSTFRSSLICG